MASIARHKARLQVQRKLKNDPLAFLADIARQNTTGGINIDDIVARVAEQALIAMLSDPRVLATMAELIAPKLGKPRDGRNGLDGLDGTDGSKGDKGEKGERGERGERGPAGSPGVSGKDGSPDKGEDIVKKVNSLPTNDESKKIDASHIKNLPGKKDLREAAALHRGGLKLVWNTQLEGTIDGSNTIFTVPATLPDPKDSKFIVSARGVLKDTDSGDFTVSNSNRTITFTDAPPEGSARPRIILYHGK